MMYCLHLFVLLKENATDYGIYKVQRFIFYNSKSSFLRVAAGETLLCCHVVDHHLWDRACWSNTCLTILYHPILTAQNNRFHNNTFIYMDFFIFGGALFSSLAFIIDRFIFVKADLSWPDPITQKSPFSRWCYRADFWVHDSQGTS